MSLMDEYKRALGNSDFHITCKSCQTVFTAKIKQFKSIVQCPKCGQQHFLDGRIQSEQND